MDVSPWKYAQGGSTEARKAKVGVSADFAKEMMDTPGVSPGMLH
jgi:hypothetical protein|tara:strand:- start:348 stop:479 length:132 start_codon:yes stop_codon:yes gene_type:complete